MVEKMKIAAAKLGGKICVDVYAVCTRYRAVGAQRLKAVGYPTVPEHLFFRKLYCHFRPVTLMWALG